MLLLYLDGHGTLFDGGIGPSDSIKRKKLPKGYRYLDQRPEEEIVTESKKPVLEEKKETNITPTRVSLEDVERLAKIFQGDLYPSNLFYLIDAIEAGVKLAREELQAALQEALLYKQIEESKREKELLNQLHSWLLNQIKGIAWTDEEIFTVLLLAKKKSSI